jgi:hypothetical protein
MAMTSTTSALHRVIYLSTAVGVLRADELDRIFLRSRAANGVAGITGLLLFCEGAFLQMLEGPLAGVSALMQKIRRDRRHAGMTIVHSAPCLTRTFPDSALHYVTARNLTPGEKQAFADLRAAVNARPAMFGPPAPGADNGVSAFLTSFAEIRAV